MLKHPVHKFKRPIEGESWVRLIDGKPHTWDPNGGPRRNGRWIKQETPSTGEVNNGGPPAVIGSPTIPPAIPSPAQVNLSSNLSSDDISLLTQLQESFMAPGTDSDAKKLLLNMVSQRIEAAKRQL